MKPGQVVRFIRESPNGSHKPLILGQLYRIDEYIKYEFTGAGGGVIVTDLDGNIQTRGDATRDGRVWFADRFEEL